MRLRSRRHRGNRANGPQNVDHSDNLSAETMSYTSYANNPKTLQNKSLHKTVDLVRNHTKIGRFHNRIVISSNSKTLRH